MLYMKNFASLMPLAAALAWLTSTLHAPAADWPMWRYNANRTADSPEKLPAQMTLRWTREFPARVPAWEDPLNQDLMPFDAVFEPVVMGERMFVGFNDSDKLVALDIRTGRQLWAFYAGGPVRLAPACWQRRVYFTSDDGCLYCVRAEDGGLVWKHRGGPSDRKVLGNSRLISTWPARGGPVVRDGVVYFAASIWPFMDTFIYALDAATGKVVWVNDGTGADFQKQPHSAPAFAGVAPQGALVATEKLLLVPGGRSVPAAFDRATGALLYFHINDSGKGTGGSTVMSNEKEFFVHTRERGTRAHDLATGKKTNFTVNEPVLGKTHVYCAANCSTNFAARAEAELKLETARQAHLKAKNDLADARDMAEPGAIKRAEASLASAAKKVEQAEAIVSRVRQSAPDGAAVRVVQAWKADKSLQWEIRADGSGDLIRAGGRLYAAGSNTVIAIEPPKQGGQPAIVWSQPVQGTVRRLLAANGMLFAVTLEGRIMAFSEAKPEGGTRPPGAFTPETNAATNAPGGRVPPEQAREIIERTGAREGYAFVLGLGDGRLIASLAAASKLHLIGVDADAAKVDRLRRQLDSAGLYGKRIALLAAEPESFGAPPYVASLIVTDLGFSPASLRKVYESLRPYGGSLWLAGAKSVAAAGLPKAKVEVLANAMRVVREGALPGAADWTHQYGDVANSVKSDDSAVKLPVGLLWFGGNTHMDVLPRHGHGPTEQVIGGRLFIEGMDCLSARDVYTGRVLWKTKVPGLNTAGIYHDNTHLADSLTTLYSQRHIPGANARGANFVATEDRVYIAVGNHCAVLDAATGAILRDIPMPGGDWGYIGVCGDVLLGGADFARFNKRFPTAGFDFIAAISDFAASRGLAAFDRHTGALLWRADARHSFVHNGIVAAGGRVYCLDRLPKSAELKAAARGERIASPYRIVALDLRTGKPLWENTKEVFGTWLGYSKERDLLLQAGASATDRLKDEAQQGMSVLRAKDGSEIWKNSALKYNGPCILHHDLIITTPTSYKQSAGAYSLLDGRPHTITNPLTGEAQPWRVYRAYGCNTPVAAENLMTFRSGAAGFYDLQTHAGTGNLGGFKSGCSANLIVANGVLNAPDYTRTCSCPYQNQTSLALVSMPEADAWTCNLTGFNTPEGRRIARVGINLGAPGDRMAADGTLWLEYPGTGGISPQLPITVTGNSNTVFRRHSSAVSGQGHAWVFASGVRDIQSIVITPQTLKSPLPAAPQKDEESDEKDSGSAKKADKETPNPSSNGGAPLLSPARYTVRLYFAEPDDVEPGRRVFDVLLQGQPVLKNFDIVKAAGAARRGVVKEFKNVLLSPQLEVKLQPAPASVLAPVLCGVELILEAGAH
jgi:outer membrane protein assembly factor BamB